MKLSTKGRYGVRASMDLARHEGQGPISLKDIAERQGISLQYLEHLITPLIAGGIIKSTRGARGGVSLAKPAAQITLGEVIRMLEGSVAPVECVDRPELCSRSATCATRDVWAEINQAVSGVLGSMTLRDLAEKQKQKENAGNLTYQI
jgi:Rrf2 family transcriptional regulator, cysteine metabolism repressor